MTLVERVKELAQFQMALAEKQALTNAAIPSPGRSMPVQVYQARFNDEKQAEFELQVRALKFALDSPQFIAEYEDKKR